MKIIAEGYHTIFFRNFEEKKKGGGLSYPQVPVGAMYRFSLKKKKKTIHYVCILNKNLNNM